MVSIHNSAFSAMCLFTDIFLTDVIPRLSEAAPPPILLDSDPRLMEWYEVKSSVNQV